MYGTRLTNAHVKELIRTGEIRIVGFKPENMKLAHYRLRPLHLWKPAQQDGDGIHERGLPIHDFSKGSPYRFAPNEYLIVNTIEQIILAPGIVGQVIPASTLVEQCFSLVAGKLDPEYGTIDGKTQEFIMGLKNMLDEPNLFYGNRGVANISFDDFRGSRRLATRWHPQERAIFKDREMTVRRQYAMDDGVIYDDDDYE